MRIRQLGKLGIKRLGGKGELCRVRQGDGRIHDEGDDAEEETN